MDLGSLFSVASGNNEPLENFIAGQLAAAGVWESARTSDGIERVRILECSPPRLSVAGRIYAIDQSLHSFWLDIENGQWRLCFDLQTKKRNAIELYQRADELEWRIVLGALGDDA